MAGMLRSVVVSIFLVAVSLSIVSASTIDTNHIWHGHTWQNYRAIILSNNQFLSPDAADSVTLYDFSGKAVNKLSGNINDCFVSPDDKYVLIRSRGGDKYGGDARLCEIQTGVTNWSKSFTDKGIDHIYSASFSGDGKSVAIFGASDTARYSMKCCVLQTSTGIQSGSIQWHGAWGGFESVALCPDGSRGALICNGKVWMFDVVNGEPKDTGLKGEPPTNGVPPLVYSSDGKYFAFPNMSGSLRIIDAAAQPPSFVDLGKFSPINQIEPTRDGKFLVTAQDGGTMWMVFRDVCDPVASKLAEIWRSGQLPPATVFDSATKFGVSSQSCESYFCTTLYDLTTGKPRLTVDNGEKRPVDYEEEVASTPEVADPAISGTETPAVNFRTVVLTGSSVAILLVGGLVFIFVRRKSQRRLRNSVL